MSRVPPSRAFSFVSWGSLFEPLIPISTSILIRASSHGIEIGRNARVRQWGDAVREALMRTSADKQEDSQCHLHKLASMTDRIAWTGYGCLPRMARNGSRRSLDAKRATSRATLGSTEAPHLSA